MSVPPNLCLDSRAFSIEDASLWLCPHIAGVFRNQVLNRVIPVGCGKWACFSCGRRKARALIRRCRDAHFTYLLTITAPGEVDCVTAPLVRWFNGRWRMLLQWFRRNLDSVGQYVWANERGDRTGHLHKHILIEMSWVSYRRARRAIKRLGLGVVCDFKPLHGSIARQSASSAPPSSAASAPHQCLAERISLADTDARPAEHQSTLTANRVSRSRNPVRYLVKYLTKADSQWRFPRYSRLVQTNIRREVRPHVDGWEFLRLEQLCTCRYPLLFDVPGVRCLHPLDRVPRLALKTEEKLHHDLRDFRPVGVEGSEEFEKRKHQRHLEQNAVCGPENVSRETSQGWPVE